MRLTYVAEPEPARHRGAIRFAADALGERLGDRFLALNGDVLADLDLAGAAPPPRGARLAGDARPLPGRGLLRFRPGRATDADGAVAEFPRIPASRSPGEINAGAYVLERSVLDLIPAGQPGLDRARGLPAACR